jgi:hypothetical protein
LTKFVLYHVIEVVEKERGRKYSRRVNKVKNSGKSEIHFILGRGGKE